MSKTLPAKPGDTRDISSIPGSGRSPGVGNGNPFQYSCLKNSMDREEPGGPHTVHGGHEEPDMTNYAHTHAHTHSHDHKLYLAYKEKQSG